MSKSNPPHDCVQCLVLRVQGLDCAEEVSLLRRALVAHVDAEHELSFDLMQGTMTIHRTPALRNDEAIFSAVRTTGMRAERYTPEAAAARAASGRWADTRMVWLAGISGGAWALGYAAHAVAAGPMAALHGEDTPLPATLLFGISIATALVHLAPKALTSLRFLRPDMNLLMSIAVAGAVVLGEYAEAATVGFLFLVSLLMESWNLERARRSVSSLLTLTPPTARVRCPCDGDLSDKPVERVTPGSVIIVRPGERLPLDGTVIEGETLVDQSPMTGESVPVAVGVGDTVLAGTINQSGEIAVKVTCAARDTMIARMLRMIEEARNRRAPAEQWVDGFARYYTPAMMALALTIATLPPLVAGGEWSEWIYRALVVLVIACPCALVISTPVAITAALSSAARRGVLIKGGLYLEQMAGIKGIAFDKTGTLTQGRPEVTQVSPAEGVDEAALLITAAALEQGSNHPLAQAIVRHAAQLGVTVQGAVAHRAEHGLGVSGEVDGQPCWAGNADYAARWTDGAAPLESHEDGATTVLVGHGKELLGRIALRDAPRPEARAIVDTLRDQLQLKELRMLTGDHPAAARRVAEECGVTAVDAALTPEAKVHAVEAMVRRLGGVAMVGDGVNDAPALAAATVGIAMGAAGSDAALETADIALMRDDLSRLPWLISHARNTRAIIVQNITFALGTKLVFLGLTAIGAAGLWAAIAADMGASFVVILNALRLLKPRD